jgi:hypothetical protein
VEPRDRIITESGDAVGSTNGVDLPELVVITPSSRGDERLFANLHLSAPSHIRQEARRTAIGRGTEIVKVRQA